MRCDGTFVTRLVTNCFTQTQMSLKKVLKLSNKESCITLSFLRRMSYIYENLLSFNGLAS